MQGNNYFLEETDKDVNIWLLGYRGPFIPIRNFVNASIEIWLSKEMYEAWKKLFKIISIGKGGFFVLKMENLRK